MDRTPPPPGTPEPTPSTWVPPDPAAPTSPDALPIPIAVPVSTGTTRRRMDPGRVLLVVAAAVAVGGVAFAVGRVSAPSTAAAVPGGLLNGGPQGGFPDASFAPGQGGPGLGGFGGTVALTGTVSAVDGSMLTIEVGNGREVTVDIGGSAVHQQEAASSDDLTTGDSVLVQTEGFGGGRPLASPGADGGPGSAQTVTATDVTILGE